MGLLSTLQSASAYSLASMFSSVLVSAYELKSMSSWVLAYMYGSPLAWQLR